MSHLYSVSNHYQIKNVVLNVVGNNELRYYVTNFDNQVEIRVVMRTRHVFVFRVAVDLFKVYKF